ncbi:MAG: amino acid permease [Bacteroidota bacterium]
MIGHKIKSKANLGTGPVFTTAISTILGAILFLRFGYSVAHTGFLGTVAIILLGHLVTIPTAMAVAEIATNQKVEGGGAYYIISRSFGLNIGAAIGIALFLSQAISVAFYVIAFAEAFMPFTEYLQQNYNDTLGPILPYLMNKTIVGLFVMVLLSALMLTKGANIGVKALYGIVALLFLSLIMFFLGSSNLNYNNVDFFATIENPDSFFRVFTIIFPAFTGIAAGLGLSGDLKNPKKSIPKGTLWATAVGILVYLIVAYKLVTSASLDDMASDQLIMSKIAIWGPIIPIGLGAAALSSALGSVMIAPRTLQALGIDNIFPAKGINLWISKEKTKNNEPINASIISIIIAFFFVAIGDINFVAEVIAMFFMVTYAALNSISFLEHFSADPSFRPTFKSHWYISFIGALFSFWLMFKMNTSFALLSLVFMGLTYIYISKHNKDNAGFVKLFRGVIYQISRQLQVVVQKRDYNNPEYYWRPFAVIVAESTFKRKDGYDLMRWISQRYGFGTYIHYIKGFLNKETHKNAQEAMKQLISMDKGSRSNVVIDTIVSPSYTSAMAQVVQFSGISGKGHNMMIFEYFRDNIHELSKFNEIYPLTKSTNFDVCILSSSYRRYGFKKNIHIWMTSDSYKTQSLMVLLSYIILGHKEWKKGEIKIFTTYEGEKEKEIERLNHLILDKRLPIAPANIELIECKDQSQIKSKINKNSIEADLTLIEFNSEDIDNQNETFKGYDSLANILFVNSQKEKELN